LLLMHNVCVCVCLRRFDICKDFAAKCVWGREKVADAPHCH